MQTGKNKRHRFQFSLRTLMMSVVLVTLLASYSNSYYRLSRRGMKEAAEVEMEGFFYVTMDEMVDSSTCADNDALIDPAAQTPGKDRLQTILFLQPPKGAIVNSQGREPLD